MEALNQIFPVIFELPDIVKWPGLVMVALFLLKGTMKLIGFRPISAATNFAYAAIVVLVMYHWGQDIHAYLLQYLKQFA